MRLQSPVRFPRVDTGRQLWHVGAFLFATALRALPRSWRFRFAASVSIATAPLVRWTTLYRERARFRIETVRDVALERALDMLTRYDVPFDPRIEVAGAEELIAAFRSDRGVVVAGVHAMLNTYLARALADRQQAHYVVAAVPLRIPGTTRLARTLMPSPALLLKVRRLLAAGAKICLLVDRAPGSKEETVEVQTSRGPLPFSDAVFRLAESADAQVLFVSATFRGGSIVLTIEPSNGNASANTTREFADFIRRHVDSNHGASRQDDVPKLKRSRLQCDELRPEDRSTQ